MDKEHLERELSPFLSPTAAEDVKTVALENVLGITGSDEGKQFLANSETLLQGIVSLTTDSRSDIVEMAFKCLINLSTDEEISYKIITQKICENKTTEWLVSALNSEFKHADLVCKFLSNVTRSEKSARLVSKVVLECAEVGIDKMVLVLGNLTYNSNADLHYLGALLSNLSQVRDIRAKIMDRKACVIQRLLPFTAFTQSIIRRQGIIGALKNCCFDTENHEWLLSDEVDLLPRLLLPLAGPEEFDDDDMEKLPDDLQYLSPDKQREPVADIRKMLVEAILQLCATKQGRRYVKEKNTYVIMREYYGWERDHEPANETTALNLIDVLIGDEPPADMPNLKEVEIPADIQEQFYKQDEEEKESTVEHK